MNSTFQFENISIFQHGQMVHETYNLLLNAFKNHDVDFIEKWTKGLSKDFISLLIENQYDMETMEIYHVYHDCGKPFCREIDAQGKQHFPYHAEISTKIFEQCFNNNVVKDLIFHDMYFHNLKSNDLQKWLEENKDNKVFLCSLLLTAWSEIIANSSMFGGENSTSFKIKRKSLIGAGKKLQSMYI